MDDTDWAATGVFSPSKAKLAQAQAKDWNFIDAWLHKKYVSGKVPVFERNEDTLDALLALISLNETADERRGIVNRVERSALQHLTKQKNEPGNALFGSISEHLNEKGHDSIEVLTQTSLLLNTPVRSGIDELVASAIELQMRAFEMKQAETMANEQTQALKAEHDRLLDVLDHLKSDHFKPSDSLANDTSQWLKGTKHLRMKIAEYDERLAANRPAQPFLTLVEEARKEASEMEAQRLKLSEVEEDFKALQSVPHQQVLAKQLLAQAEEELQAELTTLKAMRDRSSVTP